MSLSILFGVLWVANLCFIVFLLTLKLVDGTAFTTGYLVLFSISTRFDGYCIQRVAGEVCHLNGFFSLLVCSYLTFVTLVDGCINHTVHQREVVFLFGLGLAQVSKVVS